MLLLFYAITSRDKARVLESIFKRFIPLFIIDTQTVCHWSIYTLWPHMVWKKSLFQYCGISILSSNTPLQSRGYFGRVYVWSQVKGTGVCRTAPLSSCVTDRTPLSLSLQGVYESDLSSIYLSPLPLYFYHPCFLLSPTLLQLSRFHFHLSLASRHSWFRHLFTHSHQPLKTHLMHQFPQYSSACLSILISLILSHWVFLV